MRVIFLWMACFFFAVLWTPGFNPFETPNLPIARELATSGRMSLDALPPTGVYPRGQDGRFYSRHEPVVDIVAVPAAAGALIFERTASIPFKQGFELLMMLTGAAAFATTAVLLGLVGMRLGLSMRFATGSLVVLTLGSQYLAYLGRLPDVSLAAPALAACVLAWLNAEEGRRFGWLWTGVLAGLLAAVKINMATVSLVLIALAATSPNAAQGMKTRLGRVTQFAIGAAPGFALVLFWNFVRTGSWLHAPYPEMNSQFDWRYLPIRLAGSLISPAKGMLIFTPLLCLLPLTLGTTSVCRRHPRLLMLLFGSIALTMLVIASTPAWSGGGGWGVRFYVPWLLPLLMLLVAEQRARSARWMLAAIAATSAGFVMNLAGLVTNYHYRQQLCGQAAWSWHGINACAVAALPDNLARTLGAHIPDVIVPGASAIDIWASNRLALWWYSIGYEVVPIYVSWLIAGALVCAVLGCWRLSYRRIRTES